VRPAFIKEHSTNGHYRRLCSLLEVHPSGFYAYSLEPRSDRSKRDDRLTGLSQAAYTTIARYSVISVSMAKFVARTVCVARFVAQAWRPRLAIGGHGISQKRLTQCHVTDCSGSSALIRLTRHG